MFKNKYSLRYITLAALCSLVLVGASITAATSANQVGNSTTTQTFTTDSDISPGPAISEFEDLDINKVSKKDFTWPNDVFPDTKGYRYNAVENASVSIFQINEKGFTVDTQYQKYSRNSQQLEIDGGGYYYADYTTLTNTLVIKGQKLDPTNNTITDATQLFKKTMTFGAPNTDSFRGVKDVLLSKTQPYLQLKVPITRYKVFDSSRWDQSIGVCTAEGYRRYNIPAEDSLHLIKDLSKPYEGSAVFVSEYRGKCPGAWSHIHGYLATSDVNFSIYNDYNAAGVLQGTHLLNEGFSFNSVLPKIEITESLFNKDTNVLKQDYNQKDIVKLSGAQSLPSLGGSKVVVEKTPTTGTLVFTYKPQFIFVNGVLNPYTGDGVSITVGGFAKLRTFITPLYTYPEIVVDRFLPSVIKNGNVDAEVLAKFLDLSSVPPNVTYDIINPKVDLVAGTVKYKITATNGYFEDFDETNEVTPEYTNTLQFIPRITKLVPIVNNPNKLYVSQFYDLVFDANKKLNVDQFTKYVKITAPMDDANYYLVDDSYQISTGDGTISFKLYADHYYEKDASEAEGSLEQTKTHFSLNFNLAPLPSVVQEVNDHVPTHRVDKFMDLIMDPTGKIEDIDLLKEYVVIENIPSDAEITVDPDSIEYDDYNDDFFYEYVNFDLHVSAYNENERSTRSSLPGKIIPLRVKLQSVHLETKIAAKTGYDGSLRVDRLLPKVMNASNTVVNRAALEEYVDIEALPAAGIMQIEDIKIEDHAGKLNFNIVPAISYGKDSLRLEKEKYPISLNLTMRHTPTTITVKENVKDPQRVDRFVNEIKALDKADLNTYLAKYLTVDYDQHLSVTEISSVENIKYDDIGTLTMDVVVSEAYDAEAELTTNYAIPVTLNLGRKYAPTAVSLKTSYPQASYIQDFKDVVASSNQTELYDFLKRFLNGMDTIPTGAKIDVKYDDTLTDETTGVLTFAITADQQYDADSDLQSTLYTSPNFKIQLIPIDVPPIFSTNVQWQADAPSVRTASDFFESVSPNNQVDYEALSMHLDFINLPINAQFTIINKDLQFANPNLLTFDVVINQWWDNGELKPIDPTDAVQTKTFSLTKNLLVINLDSISNTFPWWWIAVAIGSVTLVATAWFLRKNWIEEEDFKDKALSI